MFDKKSKSVQERIEEVEKVEPKPEDPYEDAYFDPDDDRESRLREVMQDSDKWDTSRLKPTTRRKKIGLACLVIGLVGYLILQYVVKG